MVAQLLAKEKNTHCSAGRVVENNMFLLSIVCIYVDPTDGASVKAFDLFCKHTMPLLVEESDRVICAGHIAATSSNEDVGWHRLSEYIGAVDIMKFDQNEGKSAYINAAIAKHRAENDAKDEEFHICTIDCDILPVDWQDNRGTLPLRMLSSLLLLAPEAGVVAPHQRGTDCRHIATVYENEIVLHHGGIDYKLYWSDRVPSSVAGGCWVFPYRAVYCKAGPFDNVGSYGPEDVFFARRIATICDLRCYLADAAEVHHYDFRCFC